MNNFAAILVTVLFYECSKICLNQANQAARVDNGARNHDGVCLYQVNTRARSHNNTVNTHISLQELVLSTSTRRTVYYRII